MKKVIALFIILTVAAGPLFRGLFFPYEMYLSLAMLSVLCACYGIMKLVRKEEWHLRSVVVYGGIGLLLAYVIAFGTAVNMRGNIEALMQYAVYLLLFIVLSDFFHEHIQNLPWMYFVPLIAIGFFAAIIGLVGYTRVFPELDVTVNGRRIGSTLQYANTAAIYFLLLMSFVMGILLNVRNVLLKGILAGVANVMFMALFFTSSRGVFLVVPFAVLLALVIVMPKGYRLQSLVINAVVQKNHIPLNGYFPHTEITLYLIQQYAVLPQFQIHIVKVRPIRSPMVNFIDIVFFPYIEGDGGYSAFQSMNGSIDRLSFIADLDFQIRLVGETIQIDFRFYVFTVNIRYKFHSIDKYLSYRFQPYGLPDPGCRNIPASVRFFLPILFSSRLYALKSVRNLHRQNIFFFLYKLGDINLKGNIASPMNANKLSVHPNLRFVIDGTEMQKNSFASKGFRQGNRTAVPHNLVHIRIVNHAHFALVAKRHRDFLVEHNGLFIPAFFFSSIFVVKTKVPSSV
jgi:hypothetical protein